MLQSELKKNFVALGQFLSQFKEKSYTKNDAVANNELFYDRMVGLISQSKSYNGWFTEENVIFALQSWATALTDENLTKWLSAYNFEQKAPKNIGLILAGNIPLVGFHDLVCVLISGHNALVKRSSNDQQLIQFMVDYLTALDHRFAEKIQFIDGKLEGFNAVIATGSNNTARYFDYYFNAVPNIIRKNRNSVAILTGNETKEQLTALGEDIFRYFGLGCRNVSKIFIPKNYDFTLFFEAIFTKGDVIHYEKYANNYDYNKAVFLMSNYKLLDNEFLILKEDTSYASPIASLYYEYYDSIDAILQKVNQEADNIQCIVSNDLQPNHIPFGKTQHPELWDYADGVDTIAFLNSL
ncbi:acyl-CoA reductase [Flavobacterium sp.]|uniref:acyl-CoA reductase n=1 Tax=Flavobacterium sp. TaxID=239 RepID=UPI00352930C4